MTNAFQREGSGVIPGLDGLRAVSILCVIWGHLLFAPGFPFASLSRVGNPAGLGVRLFFVISGFLITGILLREKDATGSIDVRRFYARRVLRIFPAYYGFLLAVFALAAASVLTLERADYVYALTYTFNFKGQQHTWWLGHTWSLAIEEQFYLLWPCVVLWLDRRRLTAVAAAVVIGAPAGRMLLLLAPPAVQAHWFLATPFVADPLALGAALAIVVANPRARTIATAWVSRRGVWLAAGMLASLVCLNSRPHFFPHPFVLTGLAEPLENLGLTLIVARVVLGPRDVVVRWLTSPVAVAVGVASYSLYLWQMLFISPVASAWLTFPLNVVWAMAAAAVSYLLVERPINRLKHRLSPARARVTLRAAS